MAASDGGVCSRQISVVIPSHNRASLLDVAIASVLQSPLVTSPEQIVVVDDDSQDQTEAVARRHGVKYTRVNNHNISRSRNAGLALAHSPYIAFLDDDDAWLPGNMEAQLGALADRPSAAFAYGIARCATEDLQPLPWTFPSPPLAAGIAPDRLHMDYPNVGVVLFRREAVAELGGFDPHVVYGEDADLMLRIAAHHEIVGVEVVGMLYRLRAPSKARSDYFWSHREVTRWRPKHVAVRRKAAAKFQFKMKGILYHQFYQDAAACLALGHRRDALECLLRAMRVSPARALRHTGTLGSVFLRCIAKRGLRSSQHG
jgi:glycosyltransferase involved in cell wall biosynthesis